MNRGNFSLEGGEKPCWDNYEARGLKMKSGKTVPNCVKIGSGFGDLEKHTYSYGSADFVKNLKGGAPPTPTEPKVSPFAAAATALAPVRTAIQNGIGDALYGKEDDPKKQKKGLLGISEEGKEESKKKVMKNIVVPIAKVAMELKQDVEDTANMIFNKDKYESDMKARKLKANLAWERKNGIVRDKTDDMLIVRKPRGIWTGLTSNPQVEAYAFASIGEDDKFYVRVPNPLFGIWEKINKKPSYQDFKRFGILLPSSVQARAGETITKELEDEFIFLPQEGVKELYAKLTAWGRKQLSFTPAGQAQTLANDRAFLLSKDPRTLSAIEQNIQQKYKQENEEKTLVAARTKVDADIKAEEAKETPDTEKLAKMKAGRERVIKRQNEREKERQENIIKKSDDYKRAQLIMANQRQVAAQEEAERRMTKDDKVKRLQQNIDEIKKIIATLQQAGGYEDQIALYNQQMADITEELTTLVSESVKQQAQGSVDLLQQAQVVGGGLMDCFRGRRRNRVLPVEPLPIEPPYITTPQPEPLNPYGRPTYTVPPLPPPPPGATPASPALPNVPQVSGQFTPATRLPPPRPVVGVPASQPLGCNQQHIDIINDALVIALKMLVDSNYTSHFISGLGYTPLSDLFREGGEGVRTFLNGLVDAIGEEDDNIPEAISYIGRKALEICRELIQFCQRRRIDPMGSLTNIRYNTLRLTDIRSSSGRGVGGSIPTNPALYEKAKAIVNKSYPKHSAYRSGAYVKKYKEMGGEYRDEPDGKRPLERWFKEDWKDVGNKEYPVYRPTKRISKDTPLTPDEIDPENLKLQVKEKQKIRGKRNLSAFQKRGGARSDDEEDEDDDDDEEVEEVEVVKIDRGGGVVYLVDAPKKNAEGKLVGLPFRNFKKALSGFLGIGNRRVWDAETKEEVGILSDPIFKKLAMKVYKMEEGWRQANLDEIEAELGFELEVGGETSDEDKYDDYIPPKHFVGNRELEGSGAVEYTLQKAGKQLFNPSGDRSKAGRQSFTPDYDAYGATVAEGRKNAFNLSQSMYNQSKATELPDFKMIKDDTTIRFYRKDDEMVILVGIRGTDVKSWTDLYTWAVIGASQDLRTTARFQGDLAKLVAFQRNYPPSQFYYVAAGHSLAGSIADRFLEMGLIKEAITYNPSIEKKFVLDESIRNHRVYLDTDPLFLLMGQYAPNIEIRVNPNKTNYYNPIKEKDYLIASHTISPIYNSAFEGGGMEGSGKTYTLEEWKAIFDAKLEQKRQQIEAREAKKKQTAKAKRERAKAVRDGREKPKEPEPEAEPELEVTQFTIKGQIILVEDDDAGEKRFLDRRVFNDDDEEIGTLGSLTPEKLRKLVVERVQRAEKRGEFAPEVVFGEDEEDDDDDDDEPPPLEAPFRTSRVQKATPPKGEPKKRKPRFKIVAPASARVELREELVAEQPRTEKGKFAEEAETAVVAVSQAPQRAYMKLMKSPIFTDTERKMLMKIRETKMTPRMRAVLLGRSGLARKVMEMLGLDESAFQTQRARARIADTTEKRVVAMKARDIELAPLMDLFDKQEAGLIRFLAEKTNKKDGETIKQFITYVAKKFADCAIGTWVVVAEMLSYGARARASSWSCDGRNKIIGVEKMVDESSGGSFSAKAQMFLTKDEEKYASGAFGFVRGEPRFGLNFAGEKELADESNRNFFFPAMTRACMDMVEKIEGVGRIDRNTRYAGMGYKRRKEWVIYIDEVEPLQKRLKKEQKERIAKAEKEKAKAIGEKVGELVTEYKDIILKRGALLVERVEASLTPEQLEAVEAYEVTVSKLAVIAKKKKRLEEVEAQLGVIAGFDTSMTRRYLMPDIVAKEDKIASKAPSLRAERDKLKKEIEKLEK